MKRSIIHATILIGLMINSKSIMASSLNIEVIEPLRLGKIILTHRNGLCAINPSQTSGLGCRAVHKVQLGKIRLTGDTNTLVTLSSDKYIGEGFEATLTFYKKNTFNKISKIRLESMHWFSQQQQVSKADVDVGVEIDITDYSLVKKIVTIPSIISADY
jgi:hypothetical protein